MYKVIFILQKGTSDVYTDRQTETNFQNVNSI